LIVLTKSEVEQWFAGNTRLVRADEAHERVQCDESGLFFIDPESGCIDIEYPVKLERFAPSARILATIGYERTDFGGAFLWLTDWGVWNPLDEAPGYKIVEAMRIAGGQPKSFEAAPAHRFRADELDLAIATLLQPMVFGWDAFYFPSWSWGIDQFFLHVSHDSFVTVVTRTAAFYDKVFASLKELDFNPQPGHESQKRRFCRGTSTA
jgi:hypothetical protein